MINLSAKVKKSVCYIYYSVIPYWKGQSTGLMRHLFICASLHATIRCSEKYSPTQAVNRLFSSMRSIPFFNRSLLVYLTIDRSIIELVNWNSISLPVFVFYLTCVRVLAYLCSCFSLPVFVFWMAEAKLLVSRFVHTEWDQCWTCPALSQNV